ncbi:MAG: biotin/lipoyl-containing protein, partial [Nitrospinaceae bacterium]
PAPAPASQPPVPAAAPSSDVKEIVIAPLPGSIFTLKCQVGDSVNEGDTLIIMEAMKMETEIKAEIGGTVQSILVKDGDKINTGDQLMILV